MTGEFALIGRLRGRFPSIGDDAAVVDVPAGELLLAADVVVEGVHFRPGLDPAEVGWRAVTANVSDIAAMGGRPLHLLATVTSPSGVDFDRLFDGIADAADRYSCEVVGGDLSSGPALAVSISVTGTVDGGRAVRRSGARAGDPIYVTGPLGHAAASEYKERPVARVGEGAAARRAGATAMIDVSDGLAADLGHIADESGVGFELAHVPVAEGATLEQALHGGDDYELVVVGAAVGTRIGVCTADPEERTLAGSPISADGWEHRWS